MSSQDKLATAEVADFVLHAPKGVVVALAGIDDASLRQLVDAVEPEPGAPIALLVRLAPARTAEVIVEQIIVVLAETARRLWPTWYADVSFAGCRNDTPGHRAAAVIARRAAETIGGLSPSWAEAAVQLTLDDRLPRVRGSLPAIELAQLALAINRSGLVVVADAQAAIQGGSNGAAVVRALEWIAHHAQSAVVALFSELPRNEAPFDRILYGARRVATPASCVSAAPYQAPWIAPWRGLPHPLSDIEQRLAQALTADAELASLFRFNQAVETVRGSRPKVDLVWNGGRLVVELDGYGTHGDRASFMYDRHRDYELTLSGYTVLRLSNDEIEQDYGKAIEKIRDLVRLRRIQTGQEG